MTHRIPRWWLAAAAGGGLFTLAIALWPVHALVVSDHRTARTVFVQRVVPGDAIALGFIHSVEHCPVLDRLRIGADHTMAVVETEFASSRTGLPYAAFGAEQFHRGKDRFRISNMDRRVPEIFQWVEHRYQNTMQINDGPLIRLGTLAGDTLLHIRIEKTSVLAWSWMNARSHRHRRSNEHG